MPKVFIGVGHGGRDPGAVSGGIRESEANLQMALGMKEELGRHGVTVGLSRTREEDDPLAQEIAEANAFHPDVAVEVHNNAGGGDGFEIYRQTNVYKDSSARLAAKIEARVKQLGQQSRGIKTKLNSSGADYFGWLRQVKAPAVLCEGFFVDNAKDRADFNTAAKQRAMGKAYAHGVLDYLGIAIKAAEDKPAASGVMYTVQVGAYRSKANADNYAKQLKAKGIDAFVTIKK